MRISECGFRNREKSILKKREGYRRVFKNFDILKVSKFSEEDIILTMSGNEDFVSGEENTYRIRYKSNT